MTTGQPVGGFASIKDMALPSVLRLLKKEVMKNADK